MDISIMFPRLYEMSLFPPPSGGTKTPRFLHKDSEKKESATEYQKNKRADFRIAKN